MSRTRTAALFALTLWTAANLGWSVLLSRHRASEGSGAPAATHAHSPGPTVGDTAPLRIGRSAQRTLTLPATAREAVLAEMRIMLQSVQGIVEAGARGDSAAVGGAARPAGMAMAADPALEALLPEDWMALALATHRAFDSLPAAGADAATILTGLGRITGHCNACHEMYRLESR